MNRFQAQDNERHVKILCHLEHVPAAEPKEDPRRVFGLNISVALSGPNMFVASDRNNLEKLLQPWEWTLEELVVVSDGKPINATIQRPAKWNGRPLEEYREETLKGVLKNQWNGYEARFPSMFEFPQRTIIKNPDPSKENEIQMPWQILLGQMGTWPAPYPQLLNLSVLFAVDTRLPILAAPVIKILKDKFQPRNSFVPDPKNGPDVHVCNYTSDFKGFPIKAYVNQAPLRQAISAGKSLIDLSTHWIKPISNHTFGENWRAQLESRMADGFNLSRLIIEYLREESDKLQTVRKQVQDERDKTKAVDLEVKLREAESEAPRKARVGAEMAISCLRDLAGIGIDSGPNGQSLLMLLVEKHNGIAKESGVAPIDFKLDDAKVRKIREAEKEPFGYSKPEGEKPEAKGWRPFIRRTLLETEGLKIISNPSEVASIEQTVAELDQLHHLVFDPANLHTLVKEQWKLLKGDLGLEPEQIEAISQFINTGSDQSQPRGVVDLRRQLAHENLGFFWLDFVQSGFSEVDEKMDIKSHFSHWLKTYCLLRFKDEEVQRPSPGSFCLDSKLKAHAPNPKYPPDDFSDVDRDAFERLLAGLLDYIQCWSDDFGKNLVPPAIVDTSADLVPRTTSPNSVSLVIDRLMAYSASSTDPLTSISGLAVLMREVGDSNWHCLNLAAPQIQTRKKRKNDPSTPEYKPLLAKPVLVGLRPNYRNELSQAMISYNNNPLGSRGPATDLSGRAEDALISYECWKVVKIKEGGTEKEQGGHHLPSLKFGKKYEYLPFVIGNCGVIPKLLAVKDSPCEIKSTIAFDKAEPEIEGRIREFIYQRTVDFGSFRLFHVDGKRVMQLPKIADDVYPRARDMAIKADTIPPPTKQQLKTSGCKPNSEALRPADTSRLPLILLAPDDWKTAPSSFAFQVKLPATDVDTWDRWVAAGKLHGAPKTADEIKDLRVRVWANHFKALAESERGQYSGDQPFTVDEPALERKVIFELYEEQGTPQPRQIGRASKRVLEGQNLQPTDLGIKTIQCSGPADLNTVQSRGITVSLKVDKKAALPDTPEGPVEIVVEKGRVYRLKIYGCVAADAIPASGASGNSITPFANIFFPPLRTFTDDQGKQLCEVAPLEVLIEVATEHTLSEDGREIKNPPQILDALEITGPDEKDFKQPVKVFLKNGANNRGFPYLHRVELQRQMWRWLGRNTERYPVDEKGKTLDENVKKWEAKEYGARSDEDYLLVPMKGELTDQGNGSKIFSYSEKLGGDENGLAVKEDLRALHYRFKARAVSRYAGILPQATNDKEMDNHAPKSSRWQSHFVPCRISEGAKIPPPKVRLIIPLTESFQAANKSNTAGLLIVLDEPWHEVGGLSEILDAEVVSVTYSDAPAKPTPSNGKSTPTPTPTPKTYAEVGMDPILSAVGFPPDQQFQFDGICGPIGHTFDRVDDAPYFTATSFILPAPHNLTNPDEDFAWGFCKLRLRRKINKKIASPWTAPFWVQYLPEFFLVDVDATKYRDLLLVTEVIDLPPVPEAPKATAKKLESLNIVNRNSNQVFPLLVKQPDGGTMTFDLYLVLTRKVFDATGRSGEEAYLGVFYSPGGTGKDWKKMKSPNGFDLTVKPEDRLQVRVIEVQRRNIGASLFDDEDKFWKALFEQSIEDSKRARIVKISPPIPNLKTLESYSCPR